jgi:hypothetical protein
MDMREHEPGRTDILPDFLDRGAPAVKGRDRSAVLASAPRRRSAVTAVAAAGLLALLAAAYAAAPDAAGSEAAFLAENQAAMDKMMAGMQVQPSGDADQDFAATMIPHHQGAIDMAQAELRYGRNEQLRRIAQEIIVDQLQEIAAMRLALGQPLPPSRAAPTTPSDMPLDASRHAEPMPMTHMQKEP